MKRKETDVVSVPLATQGAEKDIQNDEVNTFSVEIEDIGHCACVLIRVRLWHVLDGKFGYRSV